MWQDVEVEGGIEGAIGATREGDVEEDAVAAAALCPLGVLVCTFKGSRPVLTHTLPAPVPPILALTSMLEGSEEANTQVMGSTLARNGIGEGQGDVVILTAPFLSQ